MGAIGLGGLVLALAASYWLARRTSLRMQSIADALMQMVDAPHSQPNLLHIQKLHQQSHGPVQQLAGAVLAFRRALQRQHQAEEQALELLFYDPLTQLPNRRLLRERLQQALTRHAPLALLALDLDGFQHINDSCGHQVGDQVLQAVAQRLRTTTQGCEVLARTGGNSFAVLLTGLGHAATDTAAQAERMAEAMQSALAEPLQLQHTTHYISASIGITLFQAPLGNLDLPLQHAEAAMYQAKTAGRGLVRFFDPDPQARIEARLHLENDLRQAIAGEQLRLFYQLQVDGQGRACGAEVLLRWQHPQRGMVSPGEFIPLAEASDLILPIGLWVLQGACQQLHAWAQQPHLAALSIAVNVSAKQFRQPDFVQQVCQAIATSGAPAQRLKLELTESVVLEEVENTIEKMAQLRALGVRFSMDDFGTGYSSLQYLKRLPLDQLKIEQGFVRDITNDSNDAAIVQTIIAMGRSLGLEVIAEGVETPAQHAFLSTHGCDLFQNVFMISNEGVGDAVRDGLRGANHSNSLAIARICNDADRPKRRPHTHEEIVNTFLLRAAQNQHINRCRHPQPLGKTGPQPCAVADEQGHIPHGVTTSDKPLVKRGNHPLVKPTNVPPMGMACNVQMHAVLGGVLTRHFGLVAQQNMKLRLLRLGLLRHAHDIGGDTTASVVALGIRRVAHARKR